MPDPKNKGSGNTQYNAEFCRSCLRSFVQVIKHVQLNDAIKSSHKNMRSYWRQMDYSLSATSLALPTLFTPLAFWLLASTANNHQKASGVKRFGNTRLICHVVIMSISVLVGHHSVSYLLCYFSNHCLLKLFSSLLLYSLHNNIDKLWCFQSLWCNHRSQIWLVTSDFYSG